MHSIPPTLEQSLTVTQKLIQSYNRGIPETVAAAEITACKLI